MRRADRLFQIIQILRRRRLTTAAQLAGELEVSVRTVYRDIRDLIASNVPIDGEAGVGYLLADHYTFPPLMFSALELEALLLGIQFVSSWGDEELALAAKDVLAKVETGLLPHLKDRLDQSKLFALNFRDSPREKQFLSQIRMAFYNRHKLSIRYSDDNEAETARTVRPLGISFFSPEWLLTGWCELRSDFQSFRIDRIQTLDVLSDQFVDEPGKTLAEYLRRVPQENQ
ncbi:MAG: YafY family protein [Planctomycetota bacterium]